MTRLLPYQQRVVDEKAELDERLAKLRAFIRSEAFEDVAPAERHRLLRQRDAMTGYSFVLGQRIDAFRPPGPENLLVADADNPG
jgi:hypothetical protein